MKNAHKYIISGLIVLFVFVVVTKIIEVLFISSSIIVIIYAGSIYAGLRGTGNDKEITRGSYEKKDRYIG